MKNILFLLIVPGLLLMISVSEGTNWTHIASDLRTGTEFYLDKDNISSSSGGLIKAWLKEEMRQPHKENISYGKHYEEFDCEEKTFRYLNTTYYYTDSTPSATFSEISDWVNVIPETAHDYIHKFLCSAQTKSQKGE
jgi:hypothetical protein